MTAVSRDVDDRARLSEAAAVRILDWLGVPRPVPRREWLDSLLAAYVQRVPWESASRIARRAWAATLDDRVRWPVDFWDAAIAQGQGGTCFESNLAMAALLAAVGIDSTFTINDRPPTVACHTALLVRAGADRLVVDAGFPLPAAVPLPRDGAETPEVHTRWGSYSARRAQASGRFLIGQRPHPVPLAFELVDRAVPAHAYAEATRADHGPTGLFLEVVVIKKVVDGDVWRFTSGDRPWTLERFVDGVRHTTPLPETIDEASAALSRHFAIDRVVVDRALREVGP